MRVTTPPLPSGEGWGEGSYMHHNGMILIPLILPFSLREKGRIFFVSAFTWTFIDRAQYQNA